MKLWSVTFICTAKVASQNNRPFPSSKKSHFQSEAKCEAIDMKMIFNYDANKTHFHNKGFALGLVLRVRFFGTRKWPIGIKVKRRALLSRTVLFCFVLFCFVFWLGITGIWHWYRRWKLTCLSWFKRVISLLGEVSLTSVADFWWCAQGRPPIFTIQSYFSSFPSPSYFIQAPRFPRDLHPAHEAHKKEACCCL